MQAYDGTWSRFLVTIFLFMFFIKMKAYSLTTRKDARRLATAITLFLQRKWFITCYELDILLYDYHLESSSFIFSNLLTFSNLIVARDLKQLKIGPRIVCIYLTII